MIQIILSLGQCLSNNNDMFDNLLAALAYVSVCVSGMVKGTKKLLCTQMTTAMELDLLCPLDQTQNL